MTYIIGNKFKKLDWRKDSFRKPWVSRKYRRPGEDTWYHDLRCDICGRWYTYSSKDVPTIMREGRWNYKTHRPEHCGNSLCQDYFERQQKHLMKVAEGIARQCFPHAFFAEKRI